MPLSGQYSHGVRLNPAQQKPWPDDFRAIWWELLPGLHTGHGCCGGARTDLRAWFRYDQDQRRFT